MSRRNSVRFSILELEYAEVYKTDELFARILDAAACIKKPEDQPRRKTRDLHTHELQSEVR
jgi:hypothetical protein